MKRFRNNPRFQAAMEIARRHGYRVFTTSNLPGFVITGPGAPPSKTRLGLGEVCEFLEKVEHRAAKLARRRARERARRQTAAKRAQSRVAA